MKTILLAALLSGFTLTSFAQTDSTASKADTIRIGGMIIVKKPGKNGDDSRDVTITTRRRNQLSNISTNWFIFDLGFTNYNDNTNYAAAQQSGFTGSGISKDAMKLRSGKSVDVNIWIFMQKLNLAKHYVNLKYGLGLELNNYRYDDERVRFTKNPTTISLDPTLVKADKNKLAANYITAPVMLNFNFAPGKRQSFGFSAGISAGYLYDAHQKIKDDGHKTKLHDDFNLEKWKLSYIAELTLGPVRLYGSMATKSMWEKGLDQTPYTIGIRFSHF